MVHPDEALERLSKIYDEFGEFCAKRGNVSEADTRVKIIDRVLKEVLGWPEEVIARENPVNRGFVDYVLSSPGGRGLVIVEAKREGFSFDLAVQRGVTTYRLNGSIKTNRGLYETIEQVQRYCSEQGVRYAVVTNGYAWIAFRAVRDDIPWRMGQAVAFSSAGVIKKEFVKFWNTLSAEAVFSGRIESAFGSTPPVTRKLLRVLDSLFNPDQLLTRNRLHGQLWPIIERIFGDIAEQDEIEILQRCYVHTNTLKIVDENLKMVITDSVPHFAAVEGAVDTFPGGPHDAGRFGSAIRGAARDPAGSVFLLLGGVGSGKSTFLKRFFRFVGTDFMERAGCWFYISFLSPPSVESLEEFVYKSILSDIRDRYSHLALETKESLEEAFAEEIKVLKQTVFSPEEQQGDAYYRRLATYFERWMSDTPSYVGALIRMVRRRGKAVVICVDNVDQLSPQYQNSIFLFAQRLARELNSLTIVALREETFYSASIQRTFTAYTSRKFHISSPSFRHLIGNRLTYAREVLSRPDQKGRRLILRGGASLNSDDIAKFLEIIEKSIFSRNRNIARFIEATSSGNMREALDMFASFMYSGSTDVDKMLNIYANTGSYHVAFHEFAKSVILGDRRFYRESASKVMNVFDCGAERNSSHFTALRLLTLLLGHHGENTPEGRGFVPIATILHLFVNTFDDEEDFFRTADRLLRRSLVEVDTRATDTIRHSTYIRITAAGWYYLEFLSKSFSYLDLVLQDTPINDEYTHKRLVELVKAVDVIVDSEQTKKEKLELRFERVRVFLDYLQREEQAERERFGLDAVVGVLGSRIVDPIRTQFEHEVAGIKKRLASVFESTIEEVEMPTPPSGLVSFDEELDEGDPSTMKTEK